MQAELNDLGVPTLAFDHEQEGDQELVHLASLGLQSYEEDQQRLLESLPPSTLLHWFDQWTYRVDRINEPVVMTGEAIELCIKGWAKYAQIDVVAFTSPHKESKDKRTSVDRASMLLGAVTQALVVQETVREGIDD